MPLTDKQIKAFQPTSIDQWFTDENGLRLLIKPNGSKYWRLKYRYAGKQKTLALGVYPEVSLKQARLAVYEAKKQLSQNIDPSLERKKEKHGYSVAAQNTLNHLSKEWWEQQKGGWKDHHAERVWKRLKDNVLDKIGEMPITDITPSEVIAAVRKVEARDALDVSERVLQDIRRVCRYAVQIGVLQVNPAAELSGVLKARKRSHRPSMPLKELPLFLNELDNYTTHGRELTQIALNMLVLTFVRPGELRGARWDEFNLAESKWVIPGERMKMGDEHIVPLAHQTISLLERLRPLTGRYSLLFPSERVRSEPMSENTLGKALRILGYDGNTPGKSKATAHGFRSTASSILNEAGFNPDAIERQLSHMERNKVRKAYTQHAEYLAERATMMQKWADYLDLLKKESKVMPFPK